MKGEIEGKIKKYDVINLSGDGSSATVEKDKPYTLLKAASILGGIGTRGVSVAGSNLPDELRKALEYLSKDMRRNYTDLDPRNLTHLDFINTTCRQHGHRVDHAEGNVVYVKQEVARPSLG